MTGARILVEALKREKVSLVFGYPGGSIIPVFDVLYNDPDIRLVLPRHEQAGGHEADGYARASGKPGVVVTTGGPGATNLTTAIATAYMDSIPLVAISGQVRTNLIGTDAFQEADMTGITYPITKHNYLVKDVRDLARTVKEAFHIATTGRPGPVHISLPVDVQNAEAVFDHPREISMRNYKPTYEGHPAQIKKACNAIAAAERPVALLGGGILASGAYEEARAFIARTGIPAASTLMALGVLPSSHELFLGMAGMHGTIPANRALSEADLIIAIGARFDDRVTGNTSTFAKRARVIHMDIDPSSIGKNVEAHIPIVGDARRTLLELTNAVEAPSLDAWHAEIREWKKAHPLRYAASRDAVSPRAFFDALNRTTRDMRTIYATEVGQHQMWAAQLLRLSRPRQLITSGGLGTMGFGFPAAIGAQLADPDATVVCIAGDGSFQMNMQELALLAVHGLPVKVIVLNNGYLGMVRQWQEMFHDKRYSATRLTRTTRPPHGTAGSAREEHAPDLLKLAEAYGIPGYRICREAELERTLDIVLRDRAHEPALVEVLVPQEENVMPMVPPGASLAETIEEHPKRT